MGGRDCHAWEDTHTHTGTYRHIQAHVTRTARAPSAVSQKCKYWHDDVLLGTKTGELAAHSELVSRMLTETDSSAPMTTLKLQKDCATAYVPVDYSSLGAEELWHAAWGRPGAPPGLVYTGGYGLISHTCKI